MYFTELCAILLSVVLNYYSKGLREAAAEDKEGEDSTFFRFEVIDVSAEGLQCTLVERGENGGEGKPIVYSLETQVYH